MSKQDERAARLAEALRANLRRRKAQSREGAAARAVPSHEKVAAVTEDD